jgi:hypothetical protein
MQTQSFDTMEAASTTVIANGASASKTWCTDLHQFLDTVKPLGSFATFGVLNASMPLSHPIISVTGVGTLGLPLTKQSVEALKAVASKAPFGQGATMQYNESVRQAWQIDASKVTLEDGDEYLLSVVVQSCQELGFSSERMRILAFTLNCTSCSLTKQEGTLRRTATRKKKRVCLAP